jgi:methionine biosynthesis protein MetW
VFKGRMPVSKTLPYQWYNTPNVRVLTMTDFEQLATDLNCTILDKIAITDEQEISFLPNLRGSLAVFRLARK